MLHTSLPLLANKYPFSIHVYGESRTNDLRFYELTRQLDPVHPICVTGREGVNKQTNGDNSDGCGDGSVAGIF
jgi:hypothetical protein